MVANALPLMHDAAMKIAILVTEGPFEGHASRSALAFARAVLASGHELTRVFFHSGGVANADRLSEPPQGSPHVVRDWSRLGTEDGVDLVVCINAGRRRGVREANLAPGFRISGLGQLIEAGMIADRLVCFGA